MNVVSSAMSRMRPGRSQVVALSLVLVLLLPAILPSVTRAAGPTEILYLLKAVLTGDNPQGVAVNPTTNRVYVTSHDPSGDDGVTVIDGLTNARITTVKVGYEAKGIAVNPNTNRIFVANFTSNSVSS